MGELCDEKGSSDKYHLPSGQPGLAKWAQKNTLTTCTSQMQRQGMRQEPNSHGNVLDSASASYILHSTSPPFADFQHISIATSRVRWHVWWTNEIYYLIRHDELLQDFFGIVG